MRLSSQHSDEGHFLFINGTRVGLVGTHSVEVVSRNLSTACSDGGDLDLHNSQTNAAAPGPTHGLHLNT